METEKLVNQLTLKSIGELLGYEFIIPSYQRGYRWKSGIQVKELLKDIADYKENNQEDSFYCLQPVVVMKDKENTFELIDGQQRLTTILLILHFFNQSEFKSPKPIFNMVFETRLNQSNFIELLENEDAASKNIDLFHLFQAYKFIKNWFHENELQTPAFTGDFYRKLVQYVKVIWYDCTTENNVQTSKYEIFTRLNIGKIPLTNSELVKALLLKEEENSRIKSSAVIASEWDSIEKKMQQDDFWYFVCPKPKNYDIRIDYLFDLIKNKQEDDEDYFTFHAFLLDQESGKSSLEIWSQIKEYFMVLEEWFSDKLYYHFVGFLILNGQNINELKLDFSSSTKENFKKTLKQKSIKRASRKLESDLGRLEALNYNSDRKEIARILLLTNILTITENPSSTERFPFDLFKKQDWDIEHISSQTDLDIEGKDRSEWANTYLWYFIGIRLTEENKSSVEDKIQVLKNNKELCEHLRFVVENDDQTNTHFETAKTKINELFRSHERYHAPDEISNLCLLDQGTNRMYKNALFPVKRKHILERDKSATFVPPCTRNVFVKGYSNTFENLTHWTNEDGEQYFNELLRLFTK